jgi:hypothetical protein
MDNDCYVADPKMSTVTYKNQPAIHATRGAVPLAGNSHLYTVKRVLWSEAIEEFLPSLFVGRTLHVCCGKSLLGDIRLDLDAENNPSIICDGAKLAIASNAFDTILCDPPYNGKFQWNHNLLAELARVASQRIIFQHWFIPANNHGLYKKAQDKFHLSEAYVWQGQAYFGRAQIISVFDSHITKRALDGANVCRVIKHVYIDGTCAQCGAREPSKSDDEEAYQMLLDEAPMYYPDNPPRK